MFETRNTQGIVIVWVWIMHRTTSKFFWTFRKKHREEHHRTTGHRHRFGSATSETAHCTRPFQRILQEVKIQTYVYCVHPSDYEANFWEKYQPIVIWHGENIAFLHRFTTHSISSTVTLGFWPVGSKPRMVQPSCFVCSTCRRFYTTICILTKSSCTGFYRLSRLAKQNNRTVPFIFHFYFRTILRFL